MYAIQLATLCNVSDIERFGYERILTTYDQIQSHEVGNGELSLRTKASHDCDLHAVNQGDNQNQCGVQGDCVLNQWLEYFHTITGF